MTGTTTTATAAATQQLLTSLGTGSGVDTASLVTSLVEAQFAAKTAALTARGDTLTSQISGAATLKNTIATFASALDTLSKSGSLSTQPVSSSASVAATAIAGARLSGLSRTLSVSQLAAAQAVRTTVAVADRTAPVGTGTLSIQLGTWTWGEDADGHPVRTGLTPAAGDPISVRFDAAASLDQVAAAITAAGKAKGVSASVVTDAGGGAFLSIRGATGAANGFTIAGSGDMAAFSLDASGAGLAFASEARNARLSVDGITVERASNTVSDLVDGVSLTLKEATGLPVTLTASTPTAGLSQAVGDWVASYNEVLATLKAQTDPITGPLRADPAAKALLANLKALTSTKLLTGAAAGTPSTLAEIGVATGRDGTLSVNAATLANALKSWPDAIEAMFATATVGSDGLPAKLSAVSQKAASVVWGLGASVARYTQAKSALAGQQDTLDDQSARMKTRLTQQFAGMDAKVAAYKSAQTFLENQIKAWNRSDD
jgi:flagellar hook-associated protein 2